MFADDFDCFVVWGAGFLCVSVELFECLEIEVVDVDGAGGLCVYDCACDHCDWESPVADVVLSDDVVSEAFECFGDGVADDD